MTLEIELISIPKEEYAKFLAQQKGVASPFASTLAQLGSISYVFYVTLLIDGSLESKKIKCKIFKIS